MPLPMWLTWIRWSMSCSRPRPRWHTLPPLFRPRLESLEGRWLPSTFVVINTDDVGTGSLRQAILDANATPGTNEIDFAIGGGGAQRIHLTSDLPYITHSVIIDGTTQPGFAGSPLIDLDGTNGYDGMNGLVIFANDCTIRGLAVTNFAFPDDPCTTEWGIVLNGSGNLVEGNYLGTDVTGTRHMGNSVGVAILSGSNNRIGGTTAAERNLISGNDVGVSIYNGSNNVVLGNYIGTDFTGTASLGNGLGLEIGGSNNLIGGTTPAARNIISGNNGYQAGISVAGNGNRVEGNFIGTDVTGTHALANFEGVIVAGGSNNQIGGTEPGAGNLISGSRFNGIMAQRNGTVIQGNIIGTDVTGTLALPNGLDGIQIVGGSNNLVGGTETGAGNLISGNARYGVYIYSAGSSGAQIVQGNRIGTDVTASQALGNGGDGVHILRSNNNTVGGEAPGAGNTIAFNGNDGVLVDQGTGNAILGNAIFANASLGIELLHGANHDQAAPVITSATTDDTSITVTGTLTSAPNITFTLEFFASDPSDLGQRFLGSVQVTTDADGNATFTATFAVVLDPGMFLTATATDAANNTSRFSDPVELTG
jgi:hypothetical protein